MTATVPTDVRPRRPLLEVEDLSVCFTTGAGSLRAVDGVSLWLGRGETVAVVGESGCGKSTLARAIVGLERPAGGQLRFDGRELPASLRARGRLGRELQLIFQDPDASLDPRLTIGGAVAEALALHGAAASRAARRAEATRLLCRVGIDAPLLDRHPHELSGGQRQRVCIARALAVRPQVLVLDEAVSALDVSIRAQILNLLAELQRDEGLAYLFITHDLGVVRHLAHRVAVMYLGQIVEHAETEALFDEPMHPYTRALLGAVLPISADAPHPLPALAGDVPSPLAPPAGCRFHSRCPQAFRRCAAEPPPSYETDGRAVRCFLLDPLPPSSRSPRGGRLSAPPGSLRTSG